MRGRGAATAATGVGVISTTTRALAALSRVAACVQTVPPTTDAAPDATPDVPLDATPDFNGDGYGELGLVAEQYLGYVANDARAYLGGPSGIEATPSHSLNVHWGYGGGPGALPVALGDVNGDGYGDMGVVTTSRASGSTADTVYFTVWLGAGPRSSAISRRAFASDCSPGAAARGDFNADGFTDLVMARCEAPASGHLWVALGGVADPGTTIELTACAGGALTARAHELTRVYDVDDDVDDDLAYRDGRWFRGGPDGLTDARCGVVTRAM